ncbi:unnamed protein product [Lymnaea stagnalis]|uniref:Uncharacterized protein n=1 Tax=Lymnaea stagnalis TaxID=6523 RepID=A0AAV2I6L5_LYMST
MSTEDEFLKDSIPTQYPGSIVGPGSTINVTTLGPEYVATQHHGPNIESGGINTVTTLLPENLTLITTKTTTVSETEEVSRTMIGVYTVLSFLCLGLIILMAIFLAKKFHKKSSVAAPQSTHGNSPI